jgi:hypothetical protein
VAIIVLRFQTSEPMEGVWPASSFPLRSILALAVVAVLAALIVWIVVLLAWSRPRSVTARAVLIGAILVLTAIALWIIFVLPVYWN